MICPLCGKKKVKSRKILKNNRKKDLIMIPEDFWRTSNPIPLAITERTIQQVQHETLIRYANALRSYCEENKNCLACPFSHSDCYEYGLDSPSPCKIDRVPCDWDLEV